MDHYEDYYREELKNIGYSTYLNKRAKLFRHGAMVGFLESEVINIINFL